MPRLFLLDGTALAFRAYYAMMSSRLTAPDGSPTGAVYGFTSVLRKILEGEKPDRIAVALDPPGPTFRHKLYGPYKATREKAPEEMIAQLEPIRAVVRAHGIPIYERPGWEADDVIGTLATQADRAGWEVLIVTGDKDFMQLVNERVRLYNVFRPGVELEIQGEAEVREKFGTTPDRVIDVLALMGDSSDNVPGVKGIGEKNAVKLIADHGSLEGLLAHLSELSPKLREKIERDREMLDLSRRLVTIACDVPLDPGFAELAPPNPDPAALGELFRKLDFKSLAAKVEGAPPPRTAGRDYRLVRTRAELEQCLEEMRSAGRFAVDTETTSLFPLQARLVGVSLSAQAGRAWYVPFPPEPGAAAAPEGSLDFPEAAAPAPEILPGGRAALLAALKPLLEDPALERVGQNWKYDALVLGWHGIRMPPPEFDTMVASFCVAGSTRRHNIDALALSYFGIQKIPTSALIGTGKAQITMDRVPVEKVAEYACEDADVALRLREPLAQELAAAGLERLFREQELPLVPVLTAMEERGIRLDTALLAAQGAELELEIQEAVRAVQAEAGQEFNVNSTKALGEVLFERLRIQVAAGVSKPRRTQTGWSTDAETLEEQYGEVPIVRRLLEYRELQKLKSTYVDSLPRFVDPRTGRVHCSFSQVTAATGRLASSDPNLQNIPVRTERGRRIRAAFVAREPDARGEWVLLSADYSQIELRVMAHLSGDERLRRAFERGEDIHAATAAVVFGVAPELVTREMRSQAKVINFGLLYGMGPVRLARETGMAAAEAKAFIERYFGSFPRVREWIDRTLSEARASGFVRTLSGHRRAFPDLNSGNSRLRSLAENAAVNTPVQGSAADIIKLAMVRLEREIEGAGLAAGLLLQVHDELLLEVPVAELEATQALVTSCMEGAVELAVPLKVDCGHGRSWREAH